MGDAAAVLLPVIGTFARANVTHGRSIKGTDRVCLLLDGERP